MRLIEQCTGTGDLMRHDHFIERVDYDFSVFQGTLGEGGLPVPGLRRLEGSINLPGGAQDLVGADLILRLEDGRHLGITVSSADGRISHRTTSGCSCCC
jgi:hypothetical protein